jgi:hypothetical protein
MTVLFIDTVAISKKLGGSLAQLCPRNPPPGCAGGPWSKGFFFAFYCEITTAQPGHTGLRSRRWRGMDAFPGSAHFLQMLAGLDFLGKVGCVEPINPTARWRNFLKLRISPAFFGAAR